jgi:signal peptidase I
MYSGPGLALIAALGALGLAGCGGAHAARTTTGADAAAVAQAASTDPASGASGPKGAPITGATASSAAPVAATHRATSPTPGGSQSGNGGSRGANHHAVSGSSRKALAGGLGAHTSEPGASTPSGSPTAQTGVPYEVHTISMEPTYKPETKVYYDPTRTHPQVGEVVIFYLPVGAQHAACATVEAGGATCDAGIPGLTKTLGIKRVVGLPGDTIAIQDGHVIRNGQPEQEPSTIPCPTEAGCEFPKPITIPAGQYFIMSDNRELYHEDSRVFGPIPQEAIVGTVETDGAA